MSYTDNVANAESSGNPNSASDTSSASGLFGFTDPTWLSTVRANRPDLAGQSDAALLALKTDPALSRQMMDALTASNQGILAKNGLPVTAGTTYLAHFAGAPAAVKVLQADPDTPVEQILSPAAIAANPFLKGMTSQGLQAWAAKKMGVQMPMTQNNAPAAQAPPPAGPPAQLPQQPPPQFAQAAPTGASVASGAIPQFAPPPLMPIFAPPRRPIDLAPLRAALAARGGPIFPNQG